MAVRFHSILGGGIFWPRCELPRCEIAIRQKSSARSFDRADGITAFNPNTLQDAPEFRIDVTAHGRFNPAAFDADVAERAIVEFVQCLDGLAAREIGDDAVYPFAEQAEEDAHRAVGHRLAYGSGYRRHRTSPCFHAPKPLPPTQTLARALAP